MIIFEKKILSDKITFIVYNSTQNLPDNWNSFSDGSLFLKKDYLHTLELSSPQNMRCFFIGLFVDDELVGIALSQFLDLSQIASFGDRDNCIKMKIRNLIFKNFISKVLFIGNNMLTGQNAFHFSPNISFNEGVSSLVKAVEEIRELLRKDGQSTHLIVWKDFSENEINFFDVNQFKRYYRFSTQPNMIFQIRSHWKSVEDYLLNLEKKYRDQYKRARKKSESLSKRKLSLSEITELNTVIYDLYYTVAKKAGFNTFYLPIDHFATLKKNIIRSISVLWLF